MAKITWRAPLWCHRQPVGFLLLPFWWRLKFPGCDSNWRYCLLDNSKVNGILKSDISVEREERLSETAELPENGMHFIVETVDFRSCLLCTPMSEKTEIFHLRTLFLSWKKNQKVWNSIRVRVQLLCCAVLHFREQENLQNDKTCFTFRFFISSSGAQTFQRDKYKNRFGTLPETKSKRLLFLNSTSGKICDRVNVSSWLLRWNVS